LEDEYLITNQLGSYISGTFHKGNTRKYHGLLIISNEYLQRKLIIGSLEEKVKIGEQTYSFNSANFFPHTLAPDGAQFLSKTLLGKLAVCFEYRFPKLTINKEITLAQEANAVIVRYKVVAEEACDLTIAPFLTNRPVHKVQHFDHKDAFRAQKFLNSVKYTLSEHEQLTLKILSFNPKNLLNVDYNIELDSVVYHNFEYPVELERGYEYLEDQIRTSVISFQIEPGDNFISLQFSYENTDELLPSKINNSLKLIYDLDVKKVTKSTVPLVQLRDYLYNHYYDFLVDNNFSKTIVAGYHWFDDWGRDTFISFKGLLLCTGETHFANKILLYWASHIKNGLIPNSLTDKTFNSIDSSLWFIIAIYYYFEATKDLATLKLLFPKIKVIVSKLLEGTTYSIHTDNHGYLIWDDKQYSLTWMDAHINNSSGTERIGAAVEIQMLWYNALKCFESLNSQLKEDLFTKEMTQAYKKLSTNFNKDFWNPKAKYLFDYISNEEKNADIRPNAIIGLGLPYKILPKGKAQQVLDTAKEKLVTDLGLLTLSHDNPKFKGDYSGDQLKRDQAYHNGAIWPFLLGLYLKAQLNYSRNDAAVRDEVKQTLTTFWTKIKEKKLSYLPEIFSADDLHPDGALSQAWNYGVFLEVITELIK
jgi:predicted glycogen debranching enzyme